MNDPKLIRDAILRFLIRTAYINITEKNNELISMSMLIHTSGRMNDHEDDKKDVNKYLNILSQENDSKKKIKLFEVLDEICDKLFFSGELDTKKTNKKEILRFINKHKSKSKVLLINSKQHKQNVQIHSPSALFTFAIGGNMVSRGLTFNNHDILFQEMLR